MTEKILNNVLKTMKKDNEIREALELLSLVREIEAQSRMASDGHLTILKFTTGYKVFFETPYFEPQIRERLQSTKNEKTLSEAIRRALDTPISIEG